MVDNIKIDDPLLKFFHGLIESNEEREIISMIFKDYKDEKIIEKLINFTDTTEKGERDAKI